LFGILLLAIGIITLIMRPLAIPASFELQCLFGTGHPLRRVQLRTAADIAQYGRPVFSERHYNDTLCVHGNFVTVALKVLGYVYRKVPILHMLSVRKHKRDDSEASYLFVVGHAEWRTISS
jgi:hypothetical protein